MDPVILIKLVFIQYLYGIKSVRQTIKEIEVNVAYRWFLGLDMLDTDLFEQIFSYILEQCMKFHLIDTSVIFIDSTHVKACANSKKMRNHVAHQEALWFEEELKKEIDEDRKNIDTPEFKEKTAREKLGMVKKGEKVYIDLSGQE